MCGRYTLHQKVEDIAKRFNLATIPTDIHENYNVAPGQLMPVITEDESGRHLELMKWGLVPSWSKDPSIGFRLINARDDTVFNKPVWRKIILKQRALIPADGFYEWKRVVDGQKVQKQPYYIHPKQVNLFAFAGVWETWKDAGGLDWKTYSIITTRPNGEMATVHDRMPVILPSEDEASWLEPWRTNRADIEPLLLPYQDDGLEIFEVSGDVNTARINEEYLIYPLES